MKVNSLGFELNFANGVSVGEFYQRLEKLENKEIKLRNKTSFLYTDVIDSLICGLILSYKDNKKSLITAKDGEGDLAVTKQSLKKHEHGTEVSLFALNPSSKKGIFYSYQGSLSPMGLYDLFKKSHDSELRDKKQDYKNELTEFGSKTIKNLKNKILKKFPGAFNLSLLTTPRDLDQILSLYGEIKKISLTSSNALADAGIFTPLKDDAKKASIDIDFEKGIPAKSLTNTLRKVFKPFSKQQEETALRIIGFGHLGEELKLLVGDNINNFGRMNYDDFVDILPNTKWKNYKNCNALIRIINILNDQDAVFGKIHKNSDWKIKSAKDINSKDQMLGELA